jgi:hypothetical protein
MDSLTSSKAIAVSYRAKAATCRKAAEEMKTQAAQEALLRMAARWENHADEAEGIEA